MSREYTVILSFDVSLMATFAAESPEQAKAMALAEFEHILDNWEIDDYDIVAEQRQ